MLVAVLDRPLRTISIGGGERCTHVLEANTVFEQRLRIELNSNRRKRGAAHNDLTYALHLREALLEHVACGIVKLATRKCLRGKCENEHWSICRIHLTIGRVAFQTVRQVSVGGVDSGLNNAW